MNGDIDTNCRNDILLLAEAFSAATGLSISTISVRLYGTVTFLPDFRDGSCSITVARFCRLVEDFIDLWPEGVPFPKLSLPLGPQRKGVIYVTTWSRCRESRLRIGFSAFLPDRLDALNWEAKRNGSKLEMIGSVEGTMLLERRVHRILAPAAIGKSDRGWYHRNQLVTDFVAEMLAPGFNWKKCEAINTLDRTGYDRAVDRTNKRKKSNWGKSQRGGASDAGIR